MFISIADLQMVNISLRVLARPDQTFLPQIYRQIGTDYDERVLPSICNEVCHGVTSFLCHLNDLHDLLQTASFIYIYVTVILYNYIIYNVHSSIFQISWF
jgi:hypothetical protein